MKVVKFVIAALATSSVAPATAPPAQEYYVKQDSVTKQCAIVEKQLSQSGVTVVGPFDKVFTSKTEAKAQMKTMGCRSGTI